MNRLSKSWNDKGREAFYLYNGLGQRTGKSVNGDEEDYLLDLTKGYHNLLGIQKEERGQRFYFDGNVAAMEETGGRRIAGGRNAGERIRPAYGATENRRTAFSGLHYYMQDELGSPLRVSGYRKKEGSFIGRSEYLTYGYDEFGNDFGKELNEAGIPNPYDRQGAEQPFGYTGYRFDEVTETYFAQAREYQQRNGRFTAEDVIKGNNVIPSTLNNYNYCWNNPAIFADHDGRYPIYTIIGEGIGNTITSLGEAAGNAVSEIGTAIGNATEEIYSAVGNMVQEVGEIVGSQQPGGLSGELVKYTGNYVGNEIRTFGVEAGNIIKDVGAYAERDIKRTTSTYGAAAKTIVGDENVSGTFSRGFDISGSVGPFTTDGSIVLSTDLKGNMTIQKSFAWGITAAAEPGLSASVSIVKTITNAPDVYALLGGGGAVGGSLGGLIGIVPVCAGADFVIVGELDNKLYENYYGYSTSVGFGVPGVEGHAKMSGTGPVTETINIFDFLFESNSKE